MKLLREDESLIPGAINEVLCLESPLQGFSRVTTAEVDIEGYCIPEGSRILMSCGSANRDERKWVDPTRFDIRRDPAPIPRTSDSCSFQAAL
jgi:cytochrome P450